MLPLFASAAGKLTQGDTMKKVGLAVGVVVIAGVGLYALNNYKKKQNVQSASNKFADGSKEGLAVQYAGLIRSALYSGWFGATEDEKALYSTAIKMHDNNVSFKLVADAYRKLYNEELLVKINKLLEPGELETFNNALNGKYRHVSSSVVTALKATNPIFNLF